MMSSSKFVLVVASLSGFQSAHSIVLQLCTSEKKHLCV